MEEKINVAEILKEKPQGTKLYDWLHNIDVELDTISTTDTETVVWCTNETNNNTTCHRGYSEFGTERGYPDGLQILFPSKEMRDWTKFSWKKDMWAGDCIEHNYWLPQDRHGAYGFQLPQGSIRKLIGKELTWNDEPVELK